MVPERPRLAPIFGADVTRINVVFILFGMLCVCERRANSPYMPATYPTAVPLDLFF
jgi:hypothetical protein